MNPAKRLSRTFFSFESTSIEQDNDITIITLSDMHQCNHLTFTLGICISPFSRVITDARHTLVVSVWDFLAAAVSIYSRLTRLMGTGGQYARK